MDLLLTLDQLIVHKNKNSKQSYKWYYKNNYLNTVKFVNFFINILKKIEVLLYLYLLLHRLKKI